MIINATQSPGPALWFGLMLCLLPVYVYAMNRLPLKHFKYLNMAFVFIGWVLFLVIVIAGPKGAS